MKILFIFTGGTIGSTQNENIIYTDTSKPRKIIEAYNRKFGIDFEYDIDEPYTELSENNTGEHLRRLCACVLSHLDGGYDGIIVTHGTDTLQYSAAALGYSLGLDSIPVCIVSANRPIEHECSNALDNLHAAVKLIESGLFKGVFVPYRNENERITKVHRATRLIHSRTFSDEVSSIFDVTFGSFDKNFVFRKNRRYKEKLDEITPIDTSKLTSHSNRILFLPSYVGIRYPSLTDNPPKYILLDSYHSGTVNTGSSEAVEFFREAQKRNIHVYVTGVSNSPDYESATLFSDLSIIPLKNISPIAAYIKLWLLSSLDVEPSKKLSASLSGDVAP